MRRLALACLPAMLLGGLISKGVLRCRSRPDGVVQTVSRNSHSQPEPASQPDAMQPSIEALCHRVGRRLRARMDDQFQIILEPPFVVAGNMTSESLSRMTARSVLRPAAAMRRSYFARAPDEPITVLLFADARSYRSWAKRLYGDRNVPYFGYYKPSHRTLVMNIATGTGTLVHELTHALIDFDFPDVPTWFNEGLASLHEQCRVHEDRIVGLKNWRLAGLHQAIRAGKLRPLRELLTRDDFYGSLKGLNYAQARYFTMYMQHRGKLRAFYQRLHEHPEGADAGIRAVERVFDEKLQQVEKHFLDWVGTL
jgi:hypothetical protein